MTRTKVARRPAIHMIEEEAEALTSLAIAFETRNPQVSQLLLDEIGRARLQHRDKIAPDVVTMQSRVAFVDEANGSNRTVQLVYPKDADIETGRISILTPVGAGLIGMRTGQSIMWPDRGGRERLLTIVSVTHSMEVA